MGPSRHPTLVPPPRKIWQWLPAILRAYAELLELLEAAALPELSRAIEPLVRVGKRMRTERQDINRRLAMLAWHRDASRRPMSAPGVGPVISLAFMATVDDPDRFEKSKAIGAHLGLPRGSTSRARPTGGANQQTRRPDDGSSSL